jgi:enolase
LSLRVGRIEAVTAREILDSRGRPTVEADVRLANGLLGRASVPSGASTGRHEALELRDHDPDRFGGFGVRGAVRNVWEVIAPAVVGRDALDQAGLDTMLVELDGTPGKERLGANALLAVSIATARAAAAACGLPLWRYLAGGEPALPLPMVNIFSGGLHAPRGLAFQDFLIVPVGARRYSDALETVYAVRSAAERVLAERGLSTLKADEGGFGPALERPEHALDLLEEATRRAGYRAGAEVAFAVDVAASHFAREGRYELLHEGGLGALELVELLERLVARYPLVSIEDGLGEDDWEGWTLLTGRLGKSVQLLGDDLFTTDRLRLERGIEAGVANAVLVKMNQIGTLTETISVIEQARRAGYATVVSARSGETEDPFIADLAVATGAGQIKIGSLAQSERLAKYNQLLRIEEELGPEAGFAGASALAYRFDTTTNAPGRLPMSG